MGRPPTNVTERDMRDQEVLRANKELAAYFKGRRTEREARAALKIIKAFIRERERADPASRRPLPGAERVPAASHRRARKAKVVRKRAGRKAPHQAADRRGGGVGRIESLQVAPAPPRTEETS